MTSYSLLHDAQKGDKEAMSNIYLKFYPAIKKLSRNLDYEEAETDLTIALLELLRDIDLNKFSKGNEGQVINFIYKFLKNTSVDLFRKHVLSYKPSLGIDFDFIVDDNIVDFDGNIFVSTLLESLPLTQREVLQRKFIQGFSDKEISHSLRVSRQAINRAKNRGLNNLRIVLDNNGGGKEWKKRYLN